MLNFEQLGRTSVFEGVPPKEIEGMLNSVPTKEESFCKGETIVRQGDVIKDIGIVLKGTALAIKNGFNGEEVVVARLTPDSVFADILSGSMNFESPVAVLAQEPCRVVFINYTRLVYSPHPYSHKVLQNMIKTISLKYFAQNLHLEILMAKGVRQRVLLFLNGEREQNKSCEFSIPFDRRQLADFLGVERSALSRELSRMKGEGIIEYRKNFFHILKLEGDKP